ncbi:MAG: PEP-CTERM sorting domain-containing protein [Opitutales bacterium]
MIKKTSTIVFATTLVATFSHLNAQVLVDVNDIGSIASSSSTISGLSGTVVSSNVDFNATGSVTSSDVGESETFSFTVSGVSDWDSAAAGLSEDLGAYLSGRTADTLGGNDSGWGVGGNSISSGEAILVNFDLSNLSVSSQASFSLEGFTASRWDDGDALNYMVIDSEGSITASASGVTDAISTLGVSVGSGDTLVVGFDAGDTFRFADFTVDVVAVPEPSSVALIFGAGAGVLVMMRRRSTKS